VDRTRQIRTNALASSRRSDQSNRIAAGNPWLPHLEPSSEPAETPGVPEIVAPAPPPLTPQPGVAAPDPADQLPRRTLTREELLVPVWWVGGHGGAGETTLARLHANSRAANHAWPISPDPDRRAHTILVARTNHSGLSAAQTALRDWASGSVDADLGGLVLIADAPGRLPKELRALEQLVASAAPGTTWRIPWENEWRLGRISAERPSRQLQQLLHHLNRQE
jgi:hypothetical protein